MQPKQLGLGNKVTASTTTQDSEDKWLLGPMVELAARFHEEKVFPWLHLGRVARYAIALGKKAKLDRQSMLALQCAALLHDIGNVAVPYALLAKSSELSQDEWYMITKHAMAASLMLKAQGVPASIVSIVQAHHEWYNGKGYPLGLAAKQIPLTARILSVADAFDAMSSDRPYRLALSHKAITEEFKRGSGTQFDPNLVDILLPMLEDDISVVLPRRALRVISNDEALYPQLWFASYPYGWELENWPPTGTLSSVSASEQLLAGSKRRADLTIVDGRTVSDAGQLGPAQPLLWIDPKGAQTPAIHMPLDLGKLLLYLNAGFDLSSYESPKVVPIKVLIADPYSLFRQALKSWLDGQPEIVVVAEVKSPAEYRRAAAELDYDVAIVASDLLVGTHSTAPLKADDYHLDQEEASTDAANKKAMIVLVADEDLGRVIGGRSLSRSIGRFEPLYVPRSEASEVLVESVKESYRTAMGNRK